MSHNGDWHVDRLEVKNFRRYESLSMDLGRQVTLLIGENGSGKTAVLDAMAVMLGLLVKELGGTPHGFAAKDARIVPRDLGSRARTATLEPTFPVSGRVDAVVAGARFSWEKTLGSATGRTTWGGREVREFVANLAAAAVAPAEEERGSSHLPVIAYYGVERLLTVRRAQTPIGTSRLAAFDAALDPRSDLKRLSKFVRSLHEQVLAAEVYADDDPASARRQFEAIEQACSRVLEPVGWSRLRWNPMIDALTLSHEQHGTLPLEQLATGTKIAAGLTIDLASRMARANPDLGARNLLESTPGIVLIDEVDLHLHPIWQQRIVPSLRKTFPRVQFILTTHSPQVISTVEPENIRILSDAEVTIPKHSAGLRSNVVLQDLQGVDPAPDVPVREQLNEYLELVDSGEGRSLYAQELRAALDQQIGGAAKNEELVRADAFLTFSGLGE